MAASLRDVVSVAGILLGAPFWRGFNLPFAWLNAAVVLTFLILAWTAQKGSSRSPQVARWIRTFPAPGANGQSSDHVWWIVLAVCAVAIAISAGGRSLPRWRASVTRRGDYAPAFDNFADDIVMENGPGAGPWHRARGKDDLALMLLELTGSFSDTFHQVVRCVRLTPTLTSSRSNERQEVSPPILHGSPVRRHLIAAAQTGLTGLATGRLQSPVAGRGRVRESTQDQGQGKHPGSSASADAVGSPFGSPVAGRLCGAYLDRSSAW